MRPIAVLPFTAGHPTAQQVFAVLREQRLSYDVVTVADFARTPSAVRSTLAVALARAVDSSTIALMRTVRRLTTPTFLVLEERTEEGEIALLHAGAYDVVGATDSRELIGARLRTMYHHVHDQRPALTPYRFENLTVDPDLHEVMVDDGRVAVTRTEFRLLALLAQHPGEVHDKDLLAELLGGGTRLSPHALESHVSRLRLKITSAGGPRVIQNVRGSGYRLSRPRPARGGPTGSAGR